MNKSKRFKVIFKPSAERELRKLPKNVIAEVSSIAGKFSEEPFPKSMEKLTGAESLYRIRIGDYRIIYHLDTKEKVITIYRVRHRKEAYRKF